MKLTFFASLSDLPEQIIIPLAEGDPLTDQLTELASLFGINAALLSRDFSGKPGSEFPFYFQQEGKTNIAYLIGLGKNPSSTEIEKSFSQFISKKKEQLGSTIGVHILSNSATDDQSMESVVEAIGRGIVLGTYSIGRYKTDKSPLYSIDQEDACINFYLPSRATENVKKAGERGIIIAETQKRMLDLVNAPANHKRPEELANWAMDSGSRWGYRVDVMEKAQIEATGLHGLLAVNRGSEDPPVFIIIEYLPFGKGRQQLPKIGLVGKGVTFDTGGLSIKGSQNMHYMKSDMGGAAAVLGTMEATARLQLPVHLVGIVPATDNSVDAKSIKPGDVIQSYSSKTIEVIDTDAEGRLLLADGLAYMNRNFQPDVMIDLATLTGSCVRALGYHAGGLFTNNEQLANSLLQAGDRSGDRIWRLPLWKEYRKYMDSDVADIKNFSGLPVAGAITAAKFLETFTKEHPAWAHMDIAGVAFGNSDFSKDKSATGFGLKLLLEWMAKWDSSAV